MQKVEEFYTERGADVDHLDGLTIEFDDWWFSLRPSNTEPLLRLNVEAENSETMQKKRDEVLKMVRG